MFAGAGWSRIGSRADAGRITVTRQGKKPGAEKRAAGGNEASSVAGAQDRGSGHEGAGGEGAGNESSADHDASSNFACTQAGKKDKEPEDAGSDRSEHKRGTAGDHRRPECNA